MIMAMAAIGCLQEPPEVNCDCPEYKDCLLTVEEGKALLSCINEGTYPMECIDLYLLGGEK